MTVDIESEIGQRLHDGAVVPVVGAGVSASAARLPGWATLITNGLDYVASLGIWPDERLQAARDDFRAGDAAALTRGASTLKELLGAPHGQFPAWLKRVFTLTNESIRLPLVDAIADLCAPIVATTNYDKLLSLSHPFPFSVTWKDAAAMADIFHGESKVLHLHGIYDRAETIVFGVDDYDRLVESEAYRAVLQTLWLDRTLLFIGCSFDGLQDPDFMRFVAWTTRTFPGLTHNHVALVKAGTMDAQARRELLLQSRVMVVEYGASYDDLPSWLNRVNPHLDAARALRFTRARQILESTKGRLSDFVATLSGVMAPTAVPTSIASYADDVRPLFEQHSKRLRRERNEFVAMQRFVRQLVNEDEVREALAAWDQKQVLAKWELFYSTALAAGDALFLFERRVIARLWRMDAGVHTYVATGGLRSELEHARQMKGEIRRDTYSHENLARILRSVVWILDADASLLWPDPAQGTRIPAGAEALVVIRESGMELRALHEPATVIGSCPETPPPLRNAEATILRGVPVLVAFNTERITAWAPRDADAPVTSFRLDELPVNEQDLQGIYDVAHWHTPSGLQTSVIVGDRVYWLADLELTGSTPLGQRFVRQQVWLGDERLYGVIGQYDDVIIRIGRDGVQHVINAAMLLEHLGSFPQPLPADARLDNFRLRSVQIDGRLVLGVGARMHNGDLGSVIALIDEDVSPPAVLGAWIMPDEVAVSFTSMTDDDGSTLLFACLLRDYYEPSDQVRRARGVRTERGLVFVEDGRALRAEHDLFEILMTTPTQGFAADTSSGLFRVDLASGTSELVDGSARILGLCSFPAW